MIANESNKHLLARRRDKAIAKILAAKESEADDYLPNDVSDDLRKVILDELNNFYELAMDIMRAIDDSDGVVVLNETYFDRLDNALDEWERITSASN